MNKSESFTCYFCNNLIKNETQTGHISLCSQVLTPCPHKCGAFVQRQNLEKHKSECVNNIRKVSKGNINDIKGTSSAKQNSFDQRLFQSYNNSNSSIEEEINKLHKKFNGLEMFMYKIKSHLDTIDAQKNDSLEIQNNLKRHDRTLHKINFYNGFISEWKKQIDSQIVQLKTNLSSTIEANKQLENQSKFMQQKLLTLQNLQMDLNLLKENVYKENSYFKKTEMDFARTIEELKNLQMEQNLTIANLVNENNKSMKNTKETVENINQLVNEQKGKLANLLFDLRAVSQISSEAAERIEIEEREFKIMRQDVNQLRIDIEILEDLASSSDNSNDFGHLLWRITEVESKLIRSKENDIVFKSPVFYSHRYGYKIRIYLYLNGLNKWKDRYALACIHVLKGEYDLLLNWPCTIEGNINLKPIDNGSKPYSKYIKTKRLQGDEDEDEPHESSNTYIFIPHNILLKSSYIKDNTCFLDINLHDNMKNETNLS